MQLKDKQELRKFVKETIKKVKEGSSTANAGGFLTAKAFVGDEDAVGSEKGMEAGAPYTDEAPKKKRKDHFVKLYEASYKAFKEDTSRTPVQKVNTAILEINRRIREINQIMDHSMRLKNESQIDNAKLWKKTNEALVKISSRMSEAAKKTKKFANLKEIQGNQVKERFNKMLRMAGVNVQLNDIDVDQQDGEYIIDVYINREPYGFDLTKDNILVYQDYNKEEELGNFDQEDVIIEKLKNIFR